MFNIATTVQLLIAAEKINNSRNLTDAEKLCLLKCLSDSIMTDMPGCPEHAKIIRASIERMGRNERANLTAKEQGRKAERVEEPTEVAAGRAEESPAAPEGPTEGVTEQAEDAGRTDCPEPHAPKPSAKRKAKAKA